MITDITPDFVITSGLNKGKSVDTMYTTDRLSQKGIDELSKLYKKHDFREWEKVIQEYLQKADFVPVDFRVLTSANQNIFMDYIKHCLKSSKIKLSSWGNGYGSKYFFRRDETIEKPEKRLTSAFIYSSYWDAFGGLLDNFFAKSS